MVHDVVRQRGMGVILELVVCGFAEQVDLSEEEAECVEPRKQDARYDLPDTFFTKTKVVTTNNG